MRTRRLPLIIPAEDYNHLVELGRSEERDPLQQALWILRQALKSTEHQAAPRQSDGEVSDA